MTIHWFKFGGGAVLPMALAIAAPALAEGLPAQAGSDHPTQVAAQGFDIFEYVVEGNTLLPDTAIEKAVYPFLGEGKSIKDVEGARERLEAAYREAGYMTVLVNIPEQRVTQGVVQLKVVQGEVGRLRVTGSRYYSLGYIRDTVPSLAEGTVPNFPEVQKQLARLNSTQDRRVTPVLKAGKQPDTVDVELKVADTLPLHGSIEYNNRHSMSSPNDQMIAQLSYNNLWQRDHTLSLQYQAAPKRASDAKLAVLSYSIPADDGTFYSMYAVRSRSDSTTEVPTGPANSLIGNGDIVGLRVVRPLPGGEGFNQSVTFGIDYKKSKDRATTAGFTNYAPVAYTPLSLAYTAIQQGEGRAISQFDSSMSFLIDGFRANQQQFADSRYGARPDYMTLRSGLLRAQPLYAGWLLVGKIDGQLASGPLISNEQYSAGGADSVRGYKESEASADVGVRGMFELRTPSLIDGTPPSALYLLAYWEGAHLRKKEPLPGEQLRFNLASAGLGLRLVAYRGLSLDLDWARPLKDGPILDPASGHTATRAGDSRVLFRVNYGI